MEFQPLQSLSRIFYIHQKDVLLLKKTLMHIFIFRYFIFALFQLRTSIRNCKISFISKLVFQF